MKIVLSGPPGAGKSTQARLLAHALSLPVLSSSGTMREAATRGSPLASRALEIVRDGSLAPSDVIVGLMTERMAGPDCSSGFVVDGFPRVAGEASAFVRSSCVPDLVVDLELERSECLHRMSSRGSDGGLRHDWSSDALERRLDIHSRERHGVLLEFHRGSVPVLRLESGRHPSFVHEELLRLVSEFRDETAPRVASPSLA